MTASVGNVRSLSRCQASVWWQHAYSEKKQKIGERCDDAVVHCRFARDALNPQKADRCGVRAQKRTICTLKLYLHKLHQITCNSVMTKHLAPISHRYRYYVNDFSTWCTKM